MIIGIDLKRGRRIGVNRIDVAQRGLPIFNHNQLNIQAILLEGTAHEKYVAGIILCQQNCDRRVHNRQFLPPVM